MPPLRKSAVSAAVLVLVTLTRGATAVPHVTQVIDGLPQVIAPQQMIVSCDPAVLPDLCAAALNTVGAIVAVVGQGAFNLAILPDGVDLQGALDTLRGLPGISSAEPNRILIGSSAYPQTWNFPAMDAPGDATLLPASASADRKSTRLNSSHDQISYAVFCLKKKKTTQCVHVRSARRVVL